MQPPRCVTVPAADRDGAGGDDPNTITVSQSCQALVLIFSSPPEMHSENLLHSTIYCRGYPTCWAMLLQEALGCLIVSRPSGVNSHIKSQSGVRSQMEPVNYRCFSCRGVWTQETHKSAASLSNGRCSCIWAGLPFQNKQLRQSTFDAFIQTNLKLDKWQQGC